MVKYSQSIATTRRMLLEWHKLTFYRVKKYEQIVSLQRRMHDKLIKRCFQAIKESTQRRATHREMLSLMLQKKTITTRGKIVKILRQYVSNKAEKGLRKNQAHDFHKRLLYKNVLNSLKLHLIRNKAENAYSRTFAVFTAWKSLTREQRLLSQYLNECNYH